MAKKKVGKKRPKVKTSTLPPGKHPKNPPGIK